MKCTACIHHKRSKCNNVSGRGEYGPGRTRNRPLMFLGEAPGRDEEREGRVFVGQAGWLLDEMIRECRLNRFPVFKTNALRCRVHKERSSRTEIGIGPIRICRELWLDREIRRIRPKLIVVLGTHASRCVTDDDKARVTKLRGHRGVYLGIPVIYTFHPAAVSRDHGLWPHVKQDLLRAHDFMSGTARSRRGIDVHPGQPPSGVKRIAVDVETNSLSWHDPECKVYLGSIAWSPTKVCSYDLRSPEERKRFLRVVDACEVIVGHNVGFDALCISRILGLESVWNKRWEDTLNAFSVRYPRYPNMGLKHLAPVFCGMKEYSAPIKLHLQYEYGDLTEKQQAAFKEYNALDSIATFRLARATRSRHGEDGKIVSWLNELVKISTRMTAFGIRVDVDRVKAYDRSLCTKMNRLEIRLNPVKLTSVEQIRHHIYEKLKLRVIERTEKQRLPSCRDAVLVELEPEDRSGWIRRFRRYKEYKDTRSRYTGPLCRVDGHGLLHPDFRVTKYRDEAHDKGPTGGTGTGRISAGRFSTIPRGADIKRFFVSRYGRLGVLVSADYKANEVRVLASVSKDPYLSDVFREKKDIHTETAALILGKKVRYVSREERQSIGKKSVFGIIYDISSSGLQQQVLAAWPGCPFQPFEFEKFIVTMKEQMKVATAFMETSRQSAVLSQWVTSPIGRRFNFPNASHNAHERRAAANAPIQSGSADICNMAMQLFSKELDPDTTGYPVLTVYDSVLLDVRHDWLKKRGGKTWIRQVMCEDVPVELRKRFGWTISVPLDIDIEISRAWGT